MLSKRVDPYRFGDFTREELALLALILHDEISRLNANILAADWDALTRELNKSVTNVSKMYDEAMAAIRQIDADAGHTNWWRW